MQSGLHKHYCPEHGADFTCPKVTHCREPEVTPCPDCRAQAWADRHQMETADAYEPDDPKAPRWWR